MLIRAAKKKSNDTRTIV